MFKPRPIHAQPFRRGARAAACSAALAGVLAFPAAYAAGEAATGDPSAAPQWSEQRNLQGTMRWWIDPSSRDALRTMPLSDMPAQVAWRVAGAHDEDLSDDERHALIARAFEALRDGPGTPPGPAAGTPSAPAAPVDPSAPRFRVLATILDAWRPHRLVNAVLLALPWPMAPLFTQGGAASTVEVVDTERNRTVATFECRKSAGYGQLLYSFARIEHAGSALGQCAQALRATLREGQPTASITVAATDEGGGLSR